MKNVNGYYCSYNDSDKRIDFLKYGLLNEFGYNIENKKSIYNEENIIKKK